MDSDEGGGGGCRAQVLSAEALNQLGQGISLLLSRWTALQIAVENEWGGRDSRWKSEELAATILSWFAQSKVEHYIDDLEDILDENAVLSFNMEIDDGSIEKVAEDLMIMHEDCLKGNFESIEKLRKLGPGRDSFSQSKLVINDDEEDGSSDEEMPDMVVDEPKPIGIAGDKKKSKELPDEEGWSVVAPRSNRGKRTG